MQSMKIIMRQGKQGRGSTRKDTHMYRPIADEGPHIRLPYLTGRSIPSTKKKIIEVGILNITYPHSGKFIQKKLHKPPTFSATLTLAQK